MTDKLYTAAEALAMAPDAVAHALAQLGAQEHRGDDAVLRMARILLLTRAMEVRCRVCNPEHSPRLAILYRGVDCCMGCRFQFADAEERGDGRCDTCNAQADELKGIKYQLQGDIVLPGGGVEASVLVNARVCPDCLALLESVPGSAQPASWN